MSEALISDIVISELPADHQQASSSTNLLTRDVLPPESSPTQHDPNLDTDAPSLLSIGRRQSSRGPAESTSPTALRPDEDTLRKKQEMAAKGLLKLIRKKNIERRRAVLGEMTSSLKNAASLGGRRSDGDLEAAESDVKTPDEGYRGKSVEQSMINGYIISAIPHMPKTVATLCLVLNILFPGSGTIASGLTVFCCGKSRMSNDKDQHGTTVWVNLMVGIMQMFTVTLLLVGWIWSIVWGIYMVLLADELKAQLKEARQKELKVKVLDAMSSKLMAGRNK